jgi:prolyl oligopeptidase PreP (S9A serine peptidase family)
MVTLNEIKKLEKERPKVSLSVTVSSVNMERLNNLLQSEGIDTPISRIIDSLIGEFVNEKEKEIGIKNGKEIRD